MKPKHPLTVLLDTSFLLIMLEQRRDIDEELRDLISGPIRIATLDYVERELQHIARTRYSKVGGLANAALELLRSRKYLVLRSGIETSDADTALLSFSLSQTAPIAIATVDRRLRASLSGFGLQTVYPMRRRGLMISAGSHPVRLK
ncbi:MAG TPA: hypothetical protein VFE96_00435 [Candidatus Bathyarchaeia archaeon]|nr:hypothetical protein [Candidatus Bathyarchaeia archaeon]